MELGFRIPILSGIPDSLSCIPDSKVQDSRFHKQSFPGFRILQAKLPDSLTRGEGGRGWRGAGWVGVILRAPEKQKCYLRHYYSTLIMYFFFFIFHYSHLVIPEH